jgi:hypothetical protein
MLNKARSGFTVKPEGVLREALPVFTNLLAYECLIHYLGFSTAGGAKYSLVLIENEGQTHPLPFRERDGERVKRLR